MDDAAIVESSRLLAIVPEATEVETGQLFAENELIDEIQQRSLLYFDELLDVYIVFQTSLQDEVGLKALFKRLEIGLEAQAFGSVLRPPTAHEASTEQSRSQAEDTIWSTVIDTSEDPIIVVQERSSNDEPHNVCAIWKIAISMNRPRIRLQSPMVILKPSIKLRPLDDFVDGSSGDPYLSSGKPASMNVLEPLIRSFESQGRDTQLSVSRASKDQSVRSSPGTGPRNIRVQAPKALRALPAISSRVRYHKSSSNINRASLIASLELECAPFSNSKMELSSVMMQLSDGIVEDLVATHSPLLPLTCWPRDITVILFRLTPNGATYDTARTVNIKIEAKVLISDECQPKIRMKWQAEVDLKAALNPKFQIAEQSMQRSKRPTNLSITPASEGIDTRPVKDREGDEKTAPEDSNSRQRAISISDLGVTITFTAPKKVQIGKQFALDVLMLNGSSRSRRFVLTALARRKRADISKQMSISSPSVHTHLKSDTAAAVIDEDLLCAMQKSSMQDPTMIISTSTDVRIGPLKPGSCANVELNFIALEKGYIQFEAVRVVDVVSNDSVEIRDLPDLVAVDELDED